jgi:hypothetical protein
VVWVLWRGVKSELNVGEKVRPGWNRRDLKGEAGVVVGLGKVGDGTLARCGSHLT